jgi:pyridoxal 5'-phosphate synthase pdxT subunit
MDPLVIGVLALQGAFAKHIERLKELKVKAVEVRVPSDLLLCDALIIPGGESTVMMKQIRFIKMEKPLAEFALTKPLFGTCAGLILMSKEIIGDKMVPFNLVDVAVERNAFGRQADSFRTDLQVVLKPGHTKQVPALFIRAPRIRSVGEEVKVLAEFEGEAVLIQQGRHLACTFHPELTDDTTIHAHFLKLVSKGT